MMTPVERVLDALERQGKQVRQSAGKWMCCCPAHDDRNPSLSISEGDDGRALVHCFAGCSSEDVVNELGLQMSDLMSSTQQSFGKSPASHPVSIGYASAEEALLACMPGQTPSCKWPYHDETGNLVGMIGRWDTASSKTIRPVALIDGCWQRKQMNFPRPLYRLSAIHDQDVIVVTEGEKAADAAVSIGLVATTSAGGCNAADRSDWSPLQDCDVVILPDHDISGRKYAREVAQLSLLAGASSVKIVHLKDLYPQMPKGGDLVDVIEAAELNAKQLPDLIMTMAEDAEAGQIKKPVPESEAVIVSLDQVKPEPVEWLWPGRVPLGKLTLFAGQPGLGKSFATLDMAARISKGLDWPDRYGTGNQAGSVILLSAEDDPADTLRPRLDAAGADVSRVKVLEAVRRRGRNEEMDERKHTFDLTRDLVALRAALEANKDCRLVVIDPISSYLGSVDSHKNAEVRSVLSPLASIASEYRIAVVAVTHLNKNTNGPAINRAIGSIAFAAAARAVWAFTKDRDDQQRRLMLPVKMNLAADGTGLAYTIAQRDGHSVPVVEWEPEPIESTADDAMASEQSDEAGSALGEAVDWLQSCLEQGPVAANTVKAAANSDGIRPRTLDRAKARLRVKAGKEGYGPGSPWVWQLP